MKCDKCLNEFNEEWKLGKTYEGIDEHHNPPQFLMEKGEEWKGELFSLCRKHHTELHKEITEIIRKHSMRKTGKSDYWLWLYVSDRKKCREEIIKFTEGWIEGDSKTTTRI